MTDTRTFSRRHLWGHFSTLGDDTPVISRGDGCYVWDDQGRRYLDGLAGLFTTQVGHGRDEIARAAYEQMTRLAYFPLWGYSHPTAAELAARLARLAPDMTIGAAHQIHQEHRLGSITPGKETDIVVLGQNLFGIPAHEIHATPVLLTVRGGEVTHHEESLLQDATAGPGDMGEVGS